MDINDPTLLNPNAPPQETIPPLRTFKVRVFDLPEHLKEIVVQAHTFSFTPNGGVQFEEYAKMPGMEHERAIFLTRRAFNADTWYDIEEVVDAGNGTLGNTVTKLAKSLLN